MRHIARPYISLAFSSGYESQLRTMGIFQERATCIRREILEGYSSVEQLVRWSCRGQYPPGTRVCLGVYVLAKPHNKDHIWINKCTEGTSKRTNIKPNTTNRPRFLKSWGTRTTSLALAKHRHGKEQISLAGSTLSSLTTNHACQIESRRRPFRTPINALMTALIETCERTLYQEKSCNNQILPCSSTSACTPADNLGPGQDLNRLFGTFKVPYSSSLFPPAHFGQQDPSHSIPEYPTTPPGNTAAPSTYPALPESAATPPSASVSPP